MNLQLINLLRLELISGGIIILPTETVYGLACVESSSEKLKELKGRPDSMNFTRVYSSVDCIIHHVKNIYAKEAVKRLLPGPFTILVNTLKGSLGIRIPEHELCLAVLKGIDNVIMTSANPHGQNPAINFNQAKSYFPHLHGINGDTSKYGQASAIVDMRNVER